MPCQKKKESLWNIFVVITQLFLCLAGALKLISQEQFQNTTTKIYEIQHKFPSSTQISTLRLRHDLPIGQNDQKTKNEKWNEPDIRYNTNAEQKLTMILFCYENFDIDH